MRLALATLALLVAAPALAQPTAFCPYGQTCQNGAPQVPFPVINPVQGLSNILTLPSSNNQPPASSNWANAPIATPPPVLPPGMAPPTTPNTP